MPFTGHNAPDAGPIIPGAGHTGSASKCSSYWSHCSRCWSRWFSIKMFQLLVTLFQALVTLVQHQNVPGTGYWPHCSSSVHNFRAYNFEIKTATLVVKSKIIIKTIKTKKNVYMAGTKHYLHYLFPFLNGLNYHEQSQNRVHLLKQNAINKKIPPKCGLNYHVSKGI